MPLLLWGSSMQRRQAFQAGLDHLFELGRVTSQPPVDPHPRPLHVFGLRDVLAKQAIVQTPAVPISWRYFAGVDSGAPVAGDVNVSTPPKVTGLRYGPQVTKILEAEKALASLPEIAGSVDWELRLLRIPGVLVEAFWFTLPSQGNGSGSLVVPAGYYPTFIDNLEPGKAVPVEEFLEKVRPLAEKVLRLHDSPGAAGAPPFKPGASRA